jgi:hypothetical protein
LSRNKRCVRDANENPFACLLQKIEVAARPAGARPRNLK